jgi:hypothetical protein
MPTGPSLDDLREEEAQGFVIWGIRLQQFQGNLKKITTYPRGLVYSSILQK